MKMRGKRVSGEIQKEIYEIISKKLKNPNITEMFSIVNVEVTDNLAHAKVFVSVFSTSEEKKKATFDEIKGSAKQIRRELAKVMQMRTVPELTFILDDGMEYSAKMERIFDEIHKGEK